MLHRGRAAPLDSIGPVEAKGSAIESRRSWPSLRGIPPQRSRAGPLRGRRCRRKHGTRPGAKAALVTAQPAVICARLHAQTPTPAPQPTPGAQRRRTGRRSRPPYARCATAPGNPTGPFPWRCTRGQSAASKCRFRPALLASDGVMVLGVGRGAPRSVHGYVRCRLRIVVIGGSATSQRPFC